MAVNLEGNIIIKGKADSSLDQLMSKMAQIQSAVEMIAGPIRDWEKESIDLYKDYETNMLQARAALSDQYSSVNELNNVMETLEKQVQEWAENSVFHVSDFSEAVDNASHAGWNLEQQLEGIPRAMLLAQAGNMSLADGLSYLARALNVTGTSFEDSGTLVDQWVKASHLANLTIEDLGESLERMGVSAQFTSNTAELFTMLDVLAQTGVVGAQAGTLLRNAMLRLIAPTKKAKEAMEDLEVTQEEYNELAGESEALTKVNKALEKTGFSAYDANGQLKPMMQTFDELYDALVNIAGSEEDLLKNQEVDEILAALFPTRTISGALAFLKGVKDNWHDLYDEIVDSEGAAEKDAETVMSGLMGKQELFLSKWEEFSRKVGEELSTPLETVYETVGGLIDKLNDLPEDQLSALVGGLTGIALLGPALGVGTGVYKFFSMLGPWGTAAVAAAAGIGALVGYLQTASELEFDSQFGDLDIDVKALEKYAEGLESKYAAEQKALSTWQTALDEATTSYTNFTAALNENLLEDVLTGKTLDEKQKSNLIQYGDDIVSSVIEGIETAKERDLSLLDVLFDDMSSDEQKDALDLGFALDNAYYENIMGQARSIGEELRAALVEALKDGSIDENEREAIQATEERLNAIMQEINAYKDSEAFNEQLYKAQHVSADSITDYVDSIVQLDKEAQIKIEQDRAAAWASYKTKFDQAVENGWELEFADGTKRKVTADDWAEFESGMMGQFDAMYGDIHSKYAGLVDAAYTSLFADSKFGDAYGWLSSMMNAGSITSGENGNFNFGQGVYDDLTKMSNEQLQSMLNGFQFMAENAGAFSDALSEFGDSPEIQRMLDMFGNASKMTDLLLGELQRREAANEATPGGTDNYGNPNTDNIGGITDAQALKKILADTNMTVADSGFNFDLDAVQQAAEHYDQAVKRLAELGEDVSQYTDNSTDDWYNNWLKNQGQGIETPELPPATIDIEPNVDDLIWDDALNALVDQEVEVQVNGDVQKLRATIDGEDGRNLIEYIDADATDLDMKIWSADGLTLLEHVKGDASLLSDTIAEYDGMPITVDIKGNNLFTPADDAAGMIEDSVPDNVEMPVSPVVDESALDADLGPVPLTIEPNVEDLIWDDAMNALTDQGVDVKVNGDDQELQATIDGADGQNLLEYVDGDATNLSMKITAEDGKTLLEYVHGDASSLAATIRKYDGMTITVNIKGNKMFASGGRATEASTFGEAGPEWAIPEQHSERTAQLLNAAREASGFTWGEIMGRFGGLNADANHINVNMTYAPTINAANADGVSDVLTADKSRVERIVREAVQRALEEGKLHDELEVYA